MRTRPSTRRVVEFYATSPRLAHAWHHAAKLNKSLARLAEIQELSPTALAHDMGKQSGEFQRVVLSHADDDDRVLVDARSQPLLSSAFHLLFTGPSTHPDQVARWMRSTNIRSENRLHVVKADDLEAPQIAQLLGRVCFALGRNRGTGAASSTRTWSETSSSSGVQGTGCCTFRWSPSPL